MDKAFNVHVESLPAKLAELMSMTPVRFADLNGAEVPTSGVYVFFEGDRAVYVGRSRRLFRRLLMHRRGDSSQSSFAFKLAREATKITEPSYRRENSRRQLVPCGSRQPA